MGLSLVMDVAKKGGPYVAIAVLVGLLYMEHLKILACDAERASLSLANKQFQAMVSDQNKKIMVYHDTTEKIKARMQVLQARIDTQDRKTHTKILRIVENAPKGTCEQAIQWAVKESNGL